MPATNNIIDMDVCPLCQNPRKESLMGERRVIFCPAPDCSDWDVTEIGRVHVDQRSSYKRTFRVI